MDASSTAWSLEALADTIRARRAILFAGAGLSMSVGLPSWSELSRYIIGDLGLDPEAVGDVTHQTLAEYYRIKTGGLGPLRSWLDREWAVSEEAIRGSELHRLIVELDFPLIYTTNFDRNIEAAYRVHERPFAKIVTARDLIEAKAGVTQIVKFHGDFDDDDSLVIAETDYLDRLAFNSHLDIKLSADAMANTLLFLGYSMSDLNIRLLLHRLRKIWSRSGHERYRPRSFMFMPRPNPVQEAVLEQWGITVIAGSDPDPGVAVLGFIRALLAKVRERA
jgi:hypothetical protein